MCFFIKEINGIIDRTIIHRFIVWIGNHTLFVMGFDFFTSLIVFKILSEFGINNWLIAWGLKTFMVSIGILIVGCVLRRLRLFKIKEVLNV